MAAITVVPVLETVSPVLIPDNGDLANSNAWLQGAQPLANHAAWLRDRVPGASIANMIRNVPLCGGFGTTVAGVPAGTPWAFQANPTFKSTWLQTALGSTTPLTFPINHLLPSAGILTGCSVLLDGGTGHVGLPATMPTLSLVRWPNDIGAASFLAAATVLMTDVDASANVAAYELVHAIVLVGAETIDINAYEYAIQVRGVEGVNAINNQLTIGRCRFTVTG